MDQIYSTIRVAVASAVGILVSVFIKNFGIEVDPSMELTMTHAITFIASVGYYLTVRGVAAKFPWAEWFLAIPKAPVLVDPNNRRAVVASSKHLR